MILAATSALLTSLAGQLVMRDNIPPPPGEILSLDSRGVRVGDPDAPSSTVVVGWHLIAAVNAPHAREAEAFAQLAEDAWRATSRLERGDSYAAEPIFERLFPDARERGGPTGEAVIEGLLRCRLRRGAHVGALEAWFELVRLRSSSGALPPYDPENARGHVDPLDDETLLAPALPPVWFDSPAVRELARTDSTPRPPGEGPSPADALRAVYVAAARHEVGLPADLPDAAPENPRGYYLARDVVMARVGDAEDRRLARARLESRIREGRAPWIEAWCRVALGRSLLLEADAESRMRAVIELLHLPARYGEEHPYLAGIALHDASVALDGLDDPDGARTLREELARRYPDHPILAARGEAASLTRRTDSR